MGLDIPFGQQVFYRLLEPTYGISHDWTGEARQLPAGIEIYEMTRPDQHGTVEIQVVSGSDDLVSFWHVHKPSLQVVRLELPDEDLEAVI